MRVFLSQSDASEWLKKGKILIYPTEGVWGIGCDAFNKDAVARIYELKQRSENKSLILLCKSLEVMSNYLSPITQNDMDFIKSIGVKPTTILYPYDPNKTPNHLHNISGKLALRVSTHYHLKSLFEIFNNPIISTSANISGTKISMDTDEIKNNFDFSDVAFYNKPIGILNRPTPIIDLQTQEVIRA